MFFCFSHMYALRIYFFFRSMLGSVNLTSVTVKGVAAALEKHSPKGESKGIKAYFRMDENGILNLEKVRFLYYSFLLYRVVGGQEKHQGI